MKPVYSVSVPEYTIEEKPDFDLVGAKIDKVLKEHFLSEKIAIRVLGSQEHADKTVEDLVNIIQETGTDRYNPNRNGDRYENIELKHIDFFALDFQVTESGEYFKFLIEPFYSWPEKPIKVDIAIIYDFEKLEVVEHQYDGREGEIKRDGFIFKDPENKKESILGIILIK